MGLGTEIQACNLFRIRVQLIYCLVYQKLKPMLPVIVLIRNHISDPLPSPICHSHAQGRLRLLAGLPAPHRDGLKCIAKGFPGVNEFCIFSGKIKQGCVGSGSPLEETLSELGLKFPLPLQTGPS